MLHGTRVQSRITPTSAGGILSVRRAIAGLLLAATVVSVLPSPQDRAQAAPTCPNPASTSSSGELPTDPKFAITPQLAALLMPTQVQVEGGKVSWCQPVAPNAKAEVSYQGTEWQLYGYAVLTKSSDTVFVSSPGVIAIGQGTTYPLSAEVGNRQTVVIRAFYTQGTTLSNAAQAFTADTQTYDVKSGAIAGAPTIASVDFVAPNQVVVTVQPPANSSQRSFWLWGKPQGQYARVIAEQKPTPITATISGAPKSTYSLAAQASTPNVSHDNVSHWYSFTIPEKSTKNVSLKDTGTTPTPQEMQGKQGGVGAKTPLQERIRQCEDDYQFLPFGINEVLCAVIFSFIDGIASLQGLLVGWAVGIGVRNTFVTEAIYPNSAPGKTQNSAWQWAGPVFQTSLNLVNYAIVLMLLFLSFVNILHINIDTYGIKKAMPSLVYGVILSNFSLLLCRLLFDVADVLTATIVGDPGELTKRLAESIGFATVVSGGVVTGIGVLGGLLGATGLPLLGLIAVVLIMLVPVALFVALAVLLWIRYYVLVLLAAVSPLAFFAMGTPLTESYFKSWWDLLIKWTFMGPLAFFFLWVATLPAPTGVQAGWQSILFSSALIYAAIRVPFSLGGDIMSKWGGLTGWAGAKLANKADSYLGDYTEKKYGRRWSFKTTVGGWMKQGEAREAERTLRGEAMGQGLYEAATQIRPAAAGAWERYRKARSEGKGRLAALAAGGSAAATGLGRARTVMEEYAQQAELAGTQEMVVKAKLGETRDENDVIPKLLKALEAGDFESSRDLALQAAGGGFLSEQLAKRFINQYGTRHRAEVRQAAAVFAKVSREAYRPKYVLGNLATTNASGQVVAFGSDANDPHGGQRVAERALRDRTASMSGHKLAAELDYLIQENLLGADGQPLRPDQLESDFQRALLRLANNHRDLLQKSFEGNRNAASVKLLTDYTPEAALQDLDFGQAIPDSLSPVARSQLTQAGSFKGGQFPTGAPDKDFIAQAGELSREENWRQVQAVLKSKYTDLTNEINRVVPGVTVGAYDEGKGVVDSVLSTASSDQAREEMKRAISSQLGSKNAFLDLHSLDRTKQELDRRRAIYREHVSRADAARLRGLGRFRRARTQPAGGGAT